MRRSLVPDIINLIAFECAAKHQNFSRAAEELNLTQSAVSRQIAELELQTGLKLFERIRRRVILTEAGQRLLPEVRDLLVRSERLMIGAVAAGQRKTSLKIATLPTFGAKWLVPKLPGFLAKHQDVAFIIESRSKPFSFSEDNFDLAIHFGQPTWAGGVSTFLCHERVLPMASHHVAERVRAIGLSNIVEAPLLHLTTRPKLWADWFRAYDMQVENAYLGYRFDQFSMLTAAAIAGLGVSLLPTYLVETELRSGAVVPVFDMPLSTDNAYYIVRPEDKKENVVASLFQDWLLSELTDDIAMSPLRL
jgi:DNA-binding transcriptional LysR family regulator